jgi:mRNA-degrading endonuclease YafQ of YafQ-DinJ toxin-antitoxin module
MSGTTSIALRLDTDLKEHALSGNFSGYRELILQRVGSHDELFR